MNWQLLVAAPVIGFVGMMSGGYWGVGCGWIVVPTMLILGFDPLAAVGIGLLQMFPSTILTVIRQAPEIGWRKGEPGRSIALPLGAGAVLTSLAGRGLNGELVARFGAAPINWALMIVIALIAVQTLATRTRCYDDRMPEITPHRIRIAFGTGLATGLLSSMLGLGGGILIRPLLTGGFRVPEYYTSRIVRLLVLLTTFSGGLTYLFGSGSFDWTIFSISMLVAAGGIVGFPLGARLHRIVYDAGYAQHIHKSFAVVAVAVLTNTLLNMYGYATASRRAMLVVAALLTIYLALFAHYAWRHPKQR